MGSGLFHEFFFAAGAGDADGAFASGNLHLGFTAGTLKIAIGLPALDSGEKLGKPLILPIPLGHIPGEGAVEREKQGNVGQCLENGQLGQGTDEVKHNAENQQKQAQLIDATSSGHQTGHGGAKTLKHDENHLYCKRFLLYVISVRTAMVRRNCLLNVYECKS